MTDCSEFTGRRLDLCLGKGMDGRDAPTRDAVMAFRAKHGITNPTVWTVDQPARGLGDVIKKVTHATGIDRVVEYVSEKVTGKKGGCGCQKRQEKLNAAFPMNSVIVPITGEPIKTGVALPPLEGPANLLWFVYPRTETREIWSEQQETIRAKIKQFDGLKVCAYAVDDTTDAASLDRSLWDEVIEVQNNVTLREMTGWIPLMQRISTEPGYTVWIHAKGVVRGHEKPQLRRWCELGYDAVLNLESVRKELQNHVVAGPFRRLYRPPDWEVDWHYTGTFYAFRNKEIFSRDWTPASKMPVGWYAEAWPALVCSEQESGSLGWENVGHLYHSSSWVKA